jgi:hypothetical protein
MAADVSKVASALTEVQHAALAGAGISLGEIVAWIEAHGCDEAPLMRMTIPLIPGIPPVVKTVILAVLDIVCPAVPTPAAPTP